jgi:hypothetical protein
MAEFKADAQFARPAAHELIKSFQVNRKCFGQLEKNRPQPVRLPESHQRCFELPDAIFSIAQPISVKMGNRLGPAKGENEITVRMSQPAISNRLPENVAAAKSIVHFHGIQPAGVKLKKPGLRQIDGVKFRLPSRISPP